MSVEIGSKPLGFGWLQGTKCVSLFGSSIILAPARIQCKSQDWISDQVVNDDFLMV